MKFKYGQRSFKVQSKHGRVKEPVNFLEDSLIRQRASEISEIAHQLAGQRYSKNIARADRLYDAIERLIPEDKNQKFGRMMDEFIGTHCKAGVEMERVTYTQGLIDGLELARIILPLLKG